MNHLIDKVAGKIKQKNSSIGGIRQPNSKKIDAMINILLKKKLSINKQVNKVVMKKLGANVKADNYLLE